MTTIIGTACPAAMSLSTTAWGLHVAGPLVLVAGDAVQQIEDGVLLLPVVVRRSVHIHLALAVEDGRVVDVPGHGSVWDVARVVVRGRGAVDHQLAVCRLVGKAGQRIIRIGHGDAINDELVHVHVGRDGAESQRPYAIGALGERQRRGGSPERRGDRPPGELHFQGARSADAEGHGAVVADLGRDHVGTVWNQVLRVLLRVPVEIYLGLLGRGGHEGGQNEK